MCRGVKVDDDNDPSLTKVTPFDKFFKAAED